MRPVKVAAKSVEKRCKSKGGEGCEGKDDAAEEMMMHSNPMRPVKVVSKSAPPVARKNGKGSPRLIKSPSVRRVHLHIDDISNSKLSEPSGGKASRAVGNSGEQKGETKGTARSVTPADLTSTHTESDSAPSALHSSKHMAHLNVYRSKPNASLLRSSKQDKKNNPHSAKRHSGKPNSIRLNVNQNTATVVAPALHVPPSLMNHRLRRLTRDRRASSISKPLPLTHGERVALMVPFDGASIKRFLGDEDNRCGVQEDISIDPHRLVCMEQRLIPKVRSNAGGERIIPALAQDTGLTRGPPKGRLRAKSYVPSFEPHPGPADRNVRGVSGAAGMSSVSVHGTDMDEDVAGTFGDGRDHAFVGLDVHVRDLLLYVYTEEMRLHKNASKQGLRRRPTVIATAEAGRQATNTRNGNRPRAGTTCGGRSMLADNDAMVMVNLSDLCCNSSAARVGQKDGQRTTGQ